MIEAGNRLDLLAGNDLINTAGGINKGSVLESGCDMTIQASRDVTIVPTEVASSLFSG
ncbi:filamentous hemagglutinin family protein [Pseudomonas amygdali pv. aesculi str. 0893_23]|nr:filamentous hemagglutinin family protein [Pseudomonas amygdali pv. aesculi str. 0893_23]